MAISDKDASVARKPCEIETESLQTNSSKPHPGYTIVSFSMSQNPIIRLLSTIRGSKFLFFPQETDVAVITVLPCATAQPVNRLMLTGEIKQAVPPRKSAALRVDLRSEPLQDTSAHDTRDLWAAVSNFK